jgi:peptidoglycan-N-acetylglucosamine deacetylase
MKITWVKTHWLIKKLFPNFIWDIANTENKVYLSFDDGPTPEITQWVLNELKKHNAKATFFCIGNNIKSNPDIFQTIINDGHSIGNHTYNHLNGWKTTDENYLENVELCSKQISDGRWQMVDDSKNLENINQTIISQKSEIKNLKSEICNLFRPPYGKITLSQAKKLRQLAYKIIMWDIISYDFDKTITKEKCLENVLKNVQPGSVIVFHDSVKAFIHLEYVLPKALENLSKRGFVFEKID